MACARNCCARSSRPPGCRRASCAFPIRARTRSTSAQWRRRSPKPKPSGVTHMIFGDLFLQDIRDYRERQLAGTGIAPVFPLWHKPTAALGARHDRRRASRRISTVVDLKKLPADFAGRRFDADLLAALPARHRPLRRERRIPLLRFGRTDADAQDRRAASARRSSATALPLPICCRLSLGDDRSKSKRAARRRCALTLRRRSSGRARRSRRRSWSCRAAAW